MSISLTTQAAPSWIDLGNVFNVASRISKPFIEQIYSSCCSQAPFNSTLEFYLFPWSCQPSCVIGKEAFTEVSHEWCKRIKLWRFMFVILLVPKPVLLEDRAQKSPSTSLYCWDPCYRHGILLLEELYHFYFGRKFIHWRQVGRYLYLLLIGEDTDAHGVWMTLNRENGNLNTASTCLLII